MNYYRQNELPETVKRYKAYTDSFQEWLMKTAVQRGVENATQIAEQAKQKKGKKTYKISTEQQELLVDGIVDTKEQLKDIAGLRDLQDAIRSRKEVTQYHKVSKTLDAGHAFFNVVLESAQSKLTALIGLIPVVLKAQDLGDDASNFTVFHFSRDDSDGSDNGNEARASEGCEDTKQQERNQKNAQTVRKKRQAHNSLSKEEAALQRDFSVLCFLYELNRIRGIVREVWMAYRQEAINAITAALVTDLAQSYIQQNVAALVEDLAISRLTPQLTLTEVILQLYVKMSASAAPPTLNSASPQLSDTTLRHLLCIDAIHHIEAYRKHLPSSGDGLLPATTSNYPFMPFLLHFDAVRQKKVTLPIWDKFTEGMIRRTSTPDPSLPFGFQVVLDVHELMREDYRRVFKDVTEHGFDIAKLIRTHVDYEDHMWDIGRKPDYMSRGNMKFSNVYLSSLDALLNWIQELLRTDNTTGLGTGMTTDVFVTVHSTLAGLSMWNFNKTYHGFSIAKVRWFVTTLAHLYNAALEVGGLELVWPDLDYIIEMHGPVRIFAGGPPADPHDFLDRFYISTCVSSRVIAKDYRSTGKYYPEVPPELKKKRGLMPHFPLEDAIASYYGPDHNDGRWLRRHAVFNHLHQLSDHSLEQSRAEETKPSQEKLQELRDTFNAMADKIAPPKPKNRRKNLPRVPAPDFTQMDDTYARLLLTMRSELQAHELHSNFDYLSFYRRAFDLVLKVRNQVLFDDALQVVRRGDILKDQNPDNETLLAGLFRALKIKPKDEKIQTTGEELSTDVVPLDQLKRIAKIMEGVIRDEGDVELKRARMRLSRDWDGLKAEYAAEEAKKRNAASETDGAPTEEERPLSKPVMSDFEEGKQENVMGVEEDNIFTEQPLRLPPGHWPDDFDMDLGGSHYLITSATTTLPDAPVLESLQEFCQDAADTEQPANESSSRFDDFLDDFESELGSESDLEMDNNDDDQELEPAQSDARYLEVPQEANASAFSTLANLDQIPYQAYVSDEADDIDSWARDLQDHMSTIGEERDLDAVNAHDNIEPVGGVEEAENAVTATVRETHTPDGLLDLDNVKRSLELDSEMGGDEPEHVVLDEEVLQAVRNEAIVNQHNDEHIKRNFSCELPVDVADQGANIDEPEERQGPGNLESNKNDQMLEVDVKVVSEYTKAGLVEANRRGVDSRAEGTQLYAVDHEEESEAAYSEDAPVVTHQYDEDMASPVVEDTPRTGDADQAFFARESDKGQPHGEIEKRAMNVRSAKQEIAIQEATPELPADSVERGDVGARCLTFKDVLLRAATRKVTSLYEDSSYEVLPVPAITSMWLYSELFHDIDLLQHDESDVEEPEIEEPVPKSHHNGNPKGIFHRLTFSSTTPRTRFVYVKRTSTASRLTLSPRRKCHLRCLVSAARRHTISMRCYTLCSMARALLGKGSKLQRRLQIATTILYAKKSSTPLGLQAAWMRAHVGKLRSAEEIEKEAWESDAALD